MYHEIERKFLIESMPDLKGIKPILNEQYFLQHGDLMEERIQKKDGVCEHEIKTIFASGEWSREKSVIDEKDFNLLKARSSKVLLRESYSLSKINPRLSVKVYQGTYKGLVFAEVEFNSHEEAENYEPLEWMGTEITHCPLGRDAWLLNFDREHFLNALQTENDKLNKDMMSGSL